VNGVGKLAGEKLKGGRGRWARGAVIGIAAGKILVRYALARKVRVRAWKLPSLGNPFHGDIQTSTRST